MTRRRCGHYQTESEHQTARLCVPAIRTHGCVCAWTLFCTHTNTLKRIETVMVFFFGWVSAPGGGGQTRGPASCSVAARARDNYSVSHSPVPVPAALAGLSRTLSHALAPISGRIIITVITMFAALRLAATQSLVRRHCWDGLCG